jgi:hypothetical protein
MLWAKCIYLLNSFAVCFDQVVELIF